MVSVMARRDARSLDHGTLEEMRRQAVRRVVAGEPQAAVARSLEVHARTVNKWVQAYRRRGDAALASRKASGRPPTLGARAVARLRRIIVGKNPRQLNFGAALWSLPIVAQVITQLFDVVLHKTTVSRLLHRLGLTPQQPTRQAFQRDDAECAHWMTVEFPAIVRASRRRQSTLLFGDECGVHEEGPVGRTWGLRGARPVVRVSGARRRLNVLSAVSPRGRLWFRCFAGYLNAPTFVQFLRALLHDVKGEIDLILDRHPAHVAALTRRFVHAHRNRLRVHFLPAYAPDLNPDEHVWSYLKGRFRREPKPTDADFATEVTCAMKTIRNDRAKVRSVFGHPAVAYVREALNW